MWCDGTTEAWVTPTRVTDQQRGHSGTFSVHMISLRSMVTAVIVSVALGWTGSWPLPQAQPALSGRRLRVEELVPTLSHQQEASTLPEDANTACGTWLEDHDFYGKDLEAVPAEGRLACTLYCSQLPGCNAVTWAYYDRVCYMKRIPDDYAPVPQPDIATMRLCENQRSKEPFDEASAPKPDAAGTTVPGAEITQERNKEECLHKCVALDACDTALFNYRTKDCHALVSDTDASPQFTMDWETLRECMGGEPTECGEWIENGDLFGHDIPDTGTLTVNREECRRQCAETQDCNAVTYKKYTDKCWMKNIPPSEAHVDDTASTTFLLCPEETLAGSAGSAGEDASMDGGVIAGISISALLLLLALAGVFAVLVAGRRRKQGEGEKGATDLVSSAKDQTGSTLMVGTGSLLASRQASSHLASQRATKSDTTTELSHQEIHNLQVSTGRESGQMLDTTGSIRNPENTHNLTTGSTSTWARNMTSINETVTATGLATAHVSIHPVPGKDASEEVKRNFVHNQLDRIEALQFKEGKEGEVLEGLRFSGTGPQDRLEGGQAIVQIAYSRQSRLEYAIKFFLTKTAVDQEMDFYSGSNPLGQFLPQVRSIVPNEDKKLVDPSGHPLPPCIVMERGEPLDMWSQRNAPDRALAFTVVYHIAQRMAEFHAAGYVHRDLKPGNVMWLPRTNRWTVIDFGCAARQKHNSPIAYTLRYAAPEVINAKKRGDERMVVEESLDAWSLGVMAFEMCVGTAAFPRGMAPDQVMNELAGTEGAELPWEGIRLTPQIQNKLQLFQGSVLQLLHRDPAQRPSMRQFCRICSKVLGENTEVPTQVPSAADAEEVEVRKEESKESLEFGMNTTSVMFLGDYGTNTNGAFRTEV